MSDYQPGAVPPAGDPLADPAEAALLERIAEAKALLEAIPVTEATAHRFLEKDALEAATLLKTHDAPYHFQLKRRLMPFGIVQDWKSGVTRAAEQLAESEQRIADKVRLVGLAAELLELWHDGSDAWCWPNEHGAGCCWRMPSSEAKRYLLAAYGERNQVTLEGGRKAPMTPGRQAVSEAMDQLEAMAYSGPRRPAPALRVGGDGARLVLDLCRDDYSVVVVEGGGWQVVKPSPIAMRRTPGMQPLPLPVQGAGDALADLRRLLNFEGTEHASFWALFVGFTFSTLRPVPPYFVFGVAGDQGTGKSTTARIVRAHVDPHEVDIQPKPKSEDDLFVNADSQWLNAYDNLSTLDQHWSDAFCRISTGTGYSKRKLCTDRDTARFKVARPQIITAIIDVVAAPDLLDRSLLAQQPAIGVNADEDELYAAIGELAPRVLGQLLDAAAVALKRQRKVELHTVPRMVGPTRWVEAGAAALGLVPGQFLDAYLDSRERAGEMAIEASVVGRHLIAMLALQRVASEDQPAGPFVGTSTMLLGELDAFMRLAGRARPQGWPNTPHGMGRALHRIAPALRKLGYGVAFDRVPGTGERVVTLTPPAPKPASRDISDVSDVSIPTPTGVREVSLEQKTPSHLAEGGNERHKSHKRHKHPNGPESEAGIPFMITNVMRADLRARGFTVEQIRKMTPAQAHAHLAGEVIRPGAARPLERCAHCGGELERGDMLPLNGGGHVHQRCADNHIRARDAAPRAAGDHACNEGQAAPARRAPGRDPRAAARGRAPAA